MLRVRRAVFEAVGGGVRAVERLRGGGPPDPERVGTVLVLEYHLPLGCCVHLSPLFEALRECRPEVVLAVGTAGIGAAVLRHSPYVNHVLVTPEAEKEALAAGRSLRRQLQERGLRPDCVLTGASDQRTRIALAGMAATGAWRGGYTQAPWLYARPLALRAGASQIADNLRLAEMLGCDAGPREPRVFFSAADVARARELLREANPEGRPVLVLVTQGSGSQRTGWRGEAWTAVVRHAVERMGFCAVYVGTGADRAAIAELCAAAGGVSVAGRTTVTELAALLALGDAVVSIDTGSMHVGRAVGTPMVVLGPSWQRPEEWLPLGVPQVRILRGADRAEVPAGYRLDEIAPEAVMEAFEELVGVYPPAEEAREERVRRSVSAVDHLRG